MKEGYGIQRYARRQLFGRGKRTSQTDILPGTVVRHWPFHVPPFAFATPGHFFSVSDWFQIAPASTETVVCAAAADGRAGVLISACIRAGAQI